MIPARRFGDASSRVSVCAARIREPLTAESGGGTSLRPEGVLTRTLTAGGTSSGTSDDTSVGTFSSNSRGTSEDKSVGTSSSTSRGTFEDTSGDTSSITSDRSAACAAGRVATACAALRLPESEPEPESESESSIARERRMRLPHRGLRRAAFPPLAAPGPLADHEPCSPGGAEGPGKARLAAEEGSSRGSSVGVCWRSAPRSSDRARRRDSGATASWSTRLCAPRLGRCSSVASGSRFCECC